VNITIDFYLVVINEYCEAYHGSIQRGQELVGHVADDGLPGVK
jgi:hypothetical protein